VGRKSNFVGVIATLSILASLCGIAKGQPPGRGGRKATAPVRQNSQFKSTRERWFSLSPEDRQNFRRNAERWMQMGPEERRIMREREKVHQEHIQHEVDAVLRESGLRLEGEKRNLFEQRYMQERRRIEHALRQEVDSKRQEQLPALKERLKKEFQEPLSPTAPSKSSPAVSATPSR
jgi:hypothetical protein